MSLQPAILAQMSEQDEAGKVVRTYVLSSSSSASSDKKAGKYGGEKRVPEQAHKSILQYMIDVFLPSGFPQSVTEDYVEYQIFDSLQAFSSSIAGMLASRAVLQGRLFVSFSTCSILPMPLNSRPPFSDSPKGVGVGDSNATPTAALLLSVLQESVGRMATIAFADRFGTALEPECKMYRLTADILNDSGMILDCLSPGFPKPLRVAVLSFASCLRSLCGVCAGSSKASLSAHFATAGNLGEVNAKDSSQETVISLLGMLAGSFVVSHITSDIATWCTLILLLVIHLATNYAAVRAVSMQSLNRQRANILFSHILQHGIVLSPKEVSARERIFERGGVLRWADDEVLGKCRIGTSLSELLGRIGRRDKLSGSLAFCSSGADGESEVDVFDLLSIFEAEDYVLWASGGPAAYEAVIVLKAGCGPIDQLRAWAHALLVAERRQRGGDASGSDKAAARNGLMGELRDTLYEVRRMFDKYGDEMRAKGWHLDVAALETKAGMRLQISSTGPCTSD
ncbi:vitamin B6 photo-protection and homoeostasis-domain-containing protein [Bipolaris maydis]|nr:vitamin B6 photo-protection and homoeostasis-domain-containing protein [Bipolaris maydis]KAJ6202115.1 vitamin B6 photo-protection and homoeostasis-domain-containing protein [Bipolaris maydis]